MANEAKPQGPKFQLNGTQMLALTLIELQQAQMTAACNAIVERSGEKDAAELLHQCIVVLEQKKLAWLESSQRAVRLVASLDARPIIEGLKAG